MAAPLIRKTIEHTAGIGVTMFSCHSSGNGIDQSGAPVAASRPMTDPFVIVMI